MTRLRRAALLLVASVCVVVLACGGHHGSSSFTVRGTVVDPYEGSPTAGVKVWIAGQTMAPVVTDTTGTFVFPNVKRPYDLVLVLGSSGATVYAGVTRPDPTAETIGGYPGFAHLAHLQGTILGSHYPLGPNRHVVVAFGTPVNDGTGNVDPSTGAYTFGAAFNGPSTRPKVSFAAVEYDDTNGDPSIAGHFTGYAQGTTSLADGQTTTADLQLDPSVSTGHVPFVVTRSYTDIMRGIAFGPNPDDAYDAPYVFGYSSVSTRGSIAIPVPNPPVPVWIQMFADGANGERYFVNQLAPSDLSTMTVDFPPALTVVQPSNGASVAVGQTFQLAGSEPQSVNVFDWYRGSSVAVVLVSASPSATVPDLSAMGAVLGTGSIQFVGQTWGPAASVDDALAHGIDVTAAPRRTAYAKGLTVTMHP